MGPTFGNTVAKSAIIAIIASLLVISAYIALRFEWKYAVPVLIALMHDILITAGVYSLTGREVTTATVAALLTILGYSLYDTIIVFDRVRENVPRMPRAAFSQIVNRSMSEVVVGRSRRRSAPRCRSGAAIFGGQTLTDFAFALLVGVISGAYSSIFIASPVLTHWEEREHVYVVRRNRIAEANGGVCRPTRPATRPPRSASARRSARRAGSPSPTCPASRSRRRSSRRWSATSTSRSPPRTPPTPRGTCAPTRSSCRRSEGQARQDQEAAQQAPREGSLMGAFAWIMMGLAIWHFTIFIPDRFWGGIVGAFLGAVIGGFLFGFLINGLTVPGQNDTHLLTALEAIPGAMIGIAAAYLDRPAPRHRAALHL